MVIAVAFLSGCGSEPSPAAKHTPPTAGCRAGEMPRDGGGCIAAGVPADKCGEGFTPDDADGCAAVLPGAPCGPGQMATPSEDACRDVAPCGAGTWGDIPVEASTQYVDASYTGGNADGTPERPWVTIQQGVDAASSGAIVAVAAGSYGPVIVADTPARVWGKCPAEVEIFGGQIALFVTQGGDGAEIRDLAIRGSSGAGLVVTHAEDVVLDRLWIHDTKAPGISVEGDGGAASVTLSRSLIEATRSLGVNVLAAQATIEATVVRGTALDVDQQTARGINVQQSSDSGVRGAVTIHASVVEQNADYGVFVGGSEATLSASVVRGTTNSPAHDGSGIFARNFPDTGEPSELTVLSSLIDGNAGGGIILAASKGTVEDTVIRASLPAADGGFGRGLVAEGDPGTGALAELAVRATLIEESSEFGLAVLDSPATVESCIIRGTAPRVSDGLFGDGFGIHSGLGPASATITGSRIESNARAGVANLHSDVTLGRSRIACNGIDLTAAVHPGMTYTLDDRGGNACGCETEVACKVILADVETPDPLP